MWNDDNQSRFFHIHLVPANTIDIVYHKELRKHNGGEEGKENARKKVKRGWVAVLSTPFLLDLGPIFIYTYSTLSLTYYKILFLRLDWCDSGCWCWYCCCWQLEKICRQLSDIILVGLLSNRMLFVLQIVSQTLYWSWSFSCNSI